MTAAARSAGRVVTVHVPIRFSRGSGRKKVVTQRPVGDRGVMPTAPQTDPLLAAVARAFYWRKLVDTGAVGSIAEIAAAEGVSASYVSRLIRLTLLKPKTALRLLQCGPERGAALTLVQFARPMSAEWKKQFHRS